MDNGKLIEFLKRWRDIECDRRRIDFERGKLAFDIRAEFPSGDVGDRLFIRWCEVELSLTPHKAEQLLTRARAFSIVPDEQTWKFVGGFKSIRLLIGADKQKQVAALETVKATGKSIRTVMKDMGLAAAGDKILHASPGERVRRVHADALALAEFLARASDSGLPDDIVAIVDRYVGLAAKKCAS